MTLSLSHTVTIPLNTTETFVNFINNKITVVKLAPQTFFDKTSTMHHCYCTWKFHITWLNNLFPWFVATVVYKAGTRGKNESSHTLCVTHPHKHTDTFYLGLFLSSSMCHLTSQGQHNGKGLQCHYSFSWMLGRIPLNLHTLCPPTVMPHCWVRNSSSCVPDEICGCPRPPQTNIKRIKWKCTDNMSSIKKNVNIQTTCTTSFPFIFK